MRPLLRSSAVLACTLGAVAAPAMPPEMERLALEGQAFLYELDFDRAEAAFGRLRREHPAHPAGACLLGAAAWWKARYAFEAPDAASSRRVSRLLLEAASLAERMTISRATACEGRFFLGGTLGILAHWELLRGRYVEAAKQGRRAVQVLAKLSACPEYADDAAYGLGLYGYETSRLPWELRWLSKFIIGGYANRTKSLVLIEQAARGARYMRSDAQASLAYIHAAYDRDPPRSLTFAEMLRAERPESPIALTLVLEALAVGGRHDEVLDASARGLERARPPGSMFQREAAAYRYHQGLALLGLRRLKEAVDAFSAAINAGGRPIWVTASRLKRGCAYDLLGERERARQDYRAVLAGPDPWLQGLRARRYLKRPFRWEDLTRDLAPHGSS